MIDIQTIAFNIILHAGESKNDSFQAMESGRHGNFEEAEELLKKAGEELNEAHQAQTDLLVSEAKGEKTDITAIFVHAQDHLSMAIFAKDMATEYIEGFKLINEKLGETR